MNISWKIINSLKSISWELYNQYNLLCLYEKTIIEKNILRNNILPNYLENIDSYLKYFNLVKNQFSEDVVSSFLKLWNNNGILRFRCIYDEIHFFKYKKDTYFINYPPINIIKDMYSKNYHNQYYKENSLNLIKDYIYLYMDEYHSTLHYDISRLTSLMECHDNEDDMNYDIICINIDKEIKNIYHVYDEKMYLHWNKFKNDKFYKNLIEYNYFYPEYELEEFLIYYPKTGKVQWLKEWTEWYIPNT